MDFDTNCVFCKIVHGDIPSAKLYEDEDVMNKVMNVAQRIGQVQMEQLGAKGINILINCKEAAGQEVQHFHVHVIPRYTATDGFKLELKQMKEINLPAVAKEIKEKLDN